MKKNIWSSLALWLTIVAGTLFPLVASAQFTDPEVSNLGDVLIRFCNEDAQWVAGEMKSLFLETEAGEANDVCIYVNNSGPTDVDVILNFVDGTITADDSQNKACQPEWTTSNFGQYVDYISEVITVKAWTTKETHAEVNFTEWYAGLSYGCVTMQFAPEDSDSEDSSMFNVLSRRGYFIDFLVEGNFDLWLNIIQPAEVFENVGNSNELIVYRTDMWIYKASLSVKNPWNIAQSVTVVPTFKSLFKQPLQWRNVITQTIVDSEIKDTTSLSWTASKNAEPITKKVLPNQSVTFEFELNDALPRWNGPITLDAKLSHTPSLDFISADISDELKQTITRDFTSSFFVMPWLPIAWIVLLIIIILFASEGKKKKEEE